MGWDVLSISELVRRNAPSGLNLLEEPCHVLAGGRHGAHALFIAFDLPFLAADAEVPIDGTWYDQVIGSVML
jgi:hypothetical protein